MDADPNQTPKLEPAAGRIALRGGWYLVREDKPWCPYHLDWFLADPDDVWVAKFWDGPRAGEQDCKAFAEAMAAEAMADQGAAYQRGYRDGISAASVQIANHYVALQARRREAEAALAAWNRSLQDLVLNELAPLQDRVNRLRPPS